MMNVKVGTGNAKIAAINYSAAYKHLDLPEGNECEQYKILTTTLKSRDITDWIICTDETYQFIKKWACQG